MLDPLDVWQTGDKLTAEHLDQTRQAVEKIACFLGGEGINVFRTPGGTTLQPQPQRQPAAGPFWVYISGAEAGAGVYTGYRIEFVTNVQWQGSSPLTNAMLYIDTSGDAQQYLVWNMAEINSSGHWLTDGGSPTWTNFICYPTGLSDQQGRPIVTIHAFDIFVCSTDPTAAEFGAY